MPGYIAVQISINDPATYERYKTLAPASIARYNGKYLIRGGRTETLEGSWSPSRFVVLEFPTVELAKEWWDSREYAEAKALRQSCASTDMLLLEGAPSPAG